MTRVGGIAIFLFLTLEIYSLLPKGPAHEPKADTSVHYLSGAIHVRSTFSDGSGSPATIAQAAERAGIDFVVLTDFNNSSGRSEEKRYGNTDLYVEMEASTPAGHALAFYSHTEAKSLSDKEVGGLSYQHFLGKTSKPGLFIAVAHPTSLKEPWSQLERVADGLEVINFSSMLHAQMYDSMSDVALTLLVAPFSQFLSALRFFQIQRKDLEMWDSWNNISPGRFGILAQNAHARVGLNEQHSIAWPSYEQTFRMASNIILSSTPFPADFAERKKTVYESIHRGKLAMVFQLLWPFRGNDWLVKCPSQAPARSGESLSFAPGCRFEISLPKGLPYGARIDIWRNGELQSSIDQPKDFTSVEVDKKGSYRVEVWLRPRTLFRLLLRRDIPYVFYNPIYLN